MGKANETISNICSQSSARCQVKLQHFDIASPEHIPRLVLVMKGLVACLVDGARVRDPA